MARKLNKSKLNKLIRNIIVFISVPLIFIGVFRLVSPSVDYDEMHTDFKECINSASAEDRMIGGFDCGTFLDIVNEEFIFSVSAITVGLTLLILYFGGRFLYHYLFPEEKI